MTPVELAGVLAVTVVIPSMVSVELGISVALLELALGVVVGNLLALEPDTPWLVFVAQFASIVLTFLAGAEVDPDDFRERFGTAMTIGLVSFVGPFAVAWAVAHELLGWTTKASLIAGTALSAIFITPNAWFPAFLAGSIALILADRAHGHAVLPAFVLGLVMSRHYRRHETEQERLRVVAFAFLTPFFFLRGGMNVSLAAVFGSLGALALLVAAKMVPKVALVLPPARRAVPEHATFTTLLMSTGLTFGTISSLYGLNAHIIDRTQFSLLVTVVVLSAIVPTAIAQHWFSPALEPATARTDREVVAVPAAVGTGGGES